MEAHRPTAACGFRLMYRRSCRGCVVNIMVFARGEFGPLLAMVSFTVATRVLSTRLMLAY